MTNEKPLELSTLQEAIERYDDSLADVAKSGDYNDLLNLPSSSSGNVIYGSSTVNGNTARKLITIYSGPSTLEQYDMLIVKLERGNNVETPTIGIGQSTYNIKVGSDTPSSVNPLICTGNSILRFMYVGGYLHYIDSPGCYSAICQTSASTQEKSIVLSDNCIIRSGTKISVQFTQGNSFANTVKLVINGSRANVWASNSETSDTNQLTFDGYTTIDFVNWRGHWEVVSDPTLSDIAKTGDYNDLVNKPESGASDYSDLTGTPFEKTVVSNDTTHFYTLNSNDHIEREEGDVWRTEIDDDFKTGLLLVIENSSEFENMPTDYMEAIEVPSSILSVDIFLNVQQSIGSDITTRIFKNTLNEHVIMFKYQDAYIIGDMNLDTGYITYREEYTTSSSPIGINVWQVKYTFKGTHIVWAPKNEDEKFEMFRIRDISTGLLEIAANDYVNGTETCPTINGYIPIGIIGYERMDVLVDARLYNDNTDYVRYSLHNATSSAVQANVHFIILYTRSSFFRKAY